jgi:AcrR family transcriptional regulator
MTRADALRNRARVVEAAAEVFAEHGVDAGVDAVAVAAGVGKATVYRSFPTKEHLVAAVAVQRLRWFEEQAEAAAQADDAFAAFGRLLEAIAEVQARDRVLGGSLTGAVGDIPELAAAHADASAAVERVMARARAAGDLRADASADDVRILFGGLSRELGERGERDPAVWRRYARLVVAALRS